MAAEGNPREFNVKPFMEPGDGYAQERAPISSGQHLKYQ